MSSFGNTDDLFICGKCRASFTDLTVFLTHRTSCNGETAFDLLPAPTSVSSSLLTSEMDAIIQDVCLPISPTANIFYEATHSDMTPTNDFDLLFSSPVEQLGARNESIMSSAADSQLLENGISQLSFLECPVCDEQFDAPSVLENHVFEHSTWIDESEGINIKPSVSLDDSSSSYTDLLDDLPTTPLVCKQCTVTFMSKASLSMHKQTSKRSCGNSGSITCVDALLHF